MNESPIGSVMDVTIEEPNVDDEDNGSKIFQKDNWRFKFLPYYNELVREADKEFCIVKTSLAQSILERDLRPGFTLAIKNLISYISNYGRRFTKTDHIHVVKLLYNVLILKGLDFRVIKMVSCGLNSLLNRKMLITRDDLRVKWRPLYDLYREVAFKKLEEDGLILFPENLKENLEATITYLSDFFEDSATQEILDLVRPNICPFDDIISQTVVTATLFLPTVLKPEEHDKVGAKLWFDELYHWYSSGEFSVDNEDRLLSLFAQLASDCPFYINWTDKLDVLMDRLMQCCNLSVSGTQIGVNATSVSLIATLLACNLGGRENIVQEKLTKLFEAWEDFFHPSNSGNHLSQLISFVSKLVTTVASRISRERFFQKKHYVQIPDDRKITDQQLDFFVKSLLPCLNYAAFAKTKQDVPRIFRYCAFLAPGIILPPLLDLIYPALENITEPHRLQQTLNIFMQILVPLARDEPIPGRERLNLKLLDDGTVNDKSLRSHFITILNNILPGVDVNDVTKSALTFHIITTIFCLMPVVDCSDALHIRDDLTDEERELCSATAGFESLIEQILQKCFSIIEANSSGCHVGNVRPFSMEQVQKTTEELYNERGIYAVIRQLTKNCSSAIYEYAMNLFFEFIKDRVFDARTAVDSVCLIMNIFITAKPKVAFPKFFNYAWTKLQSLISPLTHEEEELNHGILFFYTLTCESFNRLRGDVILEYKDVIFPVLDTLLQFKCRDAYLRASSALENTMRMLVSIYPDMDEHYMAINDQSLENYLPIRNWAKIVKKNDWVMKWHVPSNEEVNLADALLQKYLFGALKCLETPENLADKEMVKYLQIVQNTVFGAAALLPFFDGTVVTKFPNNKSQPFLPCVAMLDQVRRITAPDGTNMRRCVYFKIKKLTHYILEHKKNDIKSLRVVINIFRDLLLCEGMDLMSYIYKASNHVIRKRAFNDPIRGQIMAVEMALEESIYFIHQKRMFSRPLALFTDVHVDALSLLVTLGTSMYADTRHKAQQILELCLSHVPYSYKFILDQILNIIQNQRNVSHEEFKGALYILINGKKTSISLKQDWETLLKVWPILLQAELSEKPSIIALFDFTIQCIAESFESFYISYTLPDAVMPSAEDLLKDYDNNCHKVLIQKPSLAELEKAKIFEARVNQKNMENYYALCNSLHSICLDPNLHWRHIDMAQSLVALMFRRDVPVPDEIIRLFMRLLIHDTLRTRKSALTVITSWQKIMKIRSVKVLYEIPVKLENVGPHAQWPIKYGLRKDNIELIYSMNKRIETPDEYNNTKFFTKWHTGFYTWPTEFKVLAPPNQQIAGSRTETELSNIEKDVLAILSEPGYMDKLIAFFSLEEKKGSDSFVEMNYQLFYRFLRNLGPVVWPLLAPYLDRLIASKKEGEQRLASEIVSGLLLATKLWKYEQAVQVVNWLQPRLLKCLETMTDEAETNWCTSIANIFCRMDMRQISWLYSMIFDLVRRSQDSGFHATFRLRLLHSCVVQHEWRVPHLLRDLFRHCATLVARNSQFLRGRVGAALASCTLHNVFGMYIDPEIPAEYRPMTNADMVAVINREISESVWKDVLIGGFEELSSIWETVFTNTIPRLAYDGHSSSDSPPPSISRSTSIELAVENGEVVGSLPAGPITTRTSSSKTPKPVKSHLRRASTPPVSIVKLAGKVPDMGRKREKAMVITLANSVYSSWSLSSAAQLFPSFELFPLFAYCANDPIDDELSSTCEELVISEMACSPVKPDLADHVLKIVRLAVFNSCSWKTICTTIRFLQVHIFANFYVYKAGFIDRIREILDRLMMDSQLEVRIQAGATMSGFIQSGLFTVDESFLNTFVEWSKSEDRIRRHAGVLALSAVVTAAPYKVPPYMPDVLMLICQHLRDPPPIYPTVKKTLNEFRRTHLDCWQDHKNQFNDNQLTVLTNLLVSPNYYV